MISALYCGSFDPFTLGHLSIVERALQYSSAPYRHIEKIYICVGTNEEKKPLFSQKHRIEMIKQVFKHHPNKNNIDVIDYQGLTVDLAFRLGVKYLIRGIRKNDSSSSCEEKRLSLINQKLSLARGFKLETIFIEVNDENLNLISSSLVKKLCSQKQYITAAEMVPPIVLQELLKIHLKPRFYKLFYENCHSIAETYWQDLVCSYTKRSYHNLNHLGYMFNMLDIYTSHTGYKSNDIELAIFAHDLVYDTKKDDNELQSANKVLSWYGLKYNKPNEVLINLILSTSPNRTPTTKDEALLKDLDLSILGTFVPFLFQNYKNGIQQEYHSYSKEEYLKGRFDFLNNMLSKNRIYSTEFFYNNFENQAKENIIQELFILKYQKS